MIPGRGLAMRFVVGARGRDAGAQQSAGQGERRGGLESSCRRRVGSAATGGSSRRAMTTYRVVLGREGPCGRDTASPARRMGTGRLGLPHASAHRRAMVMTRQQRVTPSCCRRCCGGLAPYGSRWWVADVARHQRNLEAGDAQRRYRRMLLRNQPTTLAATRQARPVHALAGALRPTRTPPQRRDRGRGLPSAARYAWCLLGRPQRVRSSHGGAVLSTPPRRSIKPTPSMTWPAGHEHAWFQEILSPSTGHTGKRGNPRSQPTSLSPNLRLRRRYGLMLSGLKRAAIATALREFFPPLPLL